VGRLRFPWINSAKRASKGNAKGRTMTLQYQTIVDISLELDPTSYSMRTPTGFKKDMQFEMEVLKEHDAPGGAGQIVRGVHMRLHAGSHVDAPEHNVRGGTQIHQLPLELFFGDAVIADLRDKMPGQAITEKDLEKRLDNRIRKGDRLLLRTDHNNTYDGGSEKWMKESPYLTIGATMWCIDKGVVIVGYDFYHGNDEPNAPRTFHNSRTLSEHGIITMPYLKNLDRIEKDRFTLIGLPLKMLGAEASPVRAVAVY
jgi:arylformamidase